MKLETLQFEMVKAMKLGQKFRKGVISEAIAQIKKVAIDKGIRDSIDESLVNEVLLKIKKTIEEMISTCPVSRTDLLEEYKKQMEIIDEFAPKLIVDKEEIRNFINDIVNGEFAFDKSNRGKIMKIVMPNLKGKVDMKIANKLLEEMFK